MARTTVLNALHRAWGGRMVEFAGWELPLHFGSQLDEHRRVRQAAGMFDVSHMCLFDIDGGESLAFLRWLLANDVGRLPPGQGLYTCLLNERGGILDDAIIFRRAGGGFRLVSNAATRTKITAWLEQHAAAYGVRVVARDDLALIAVQGPDTCPLAVGALPVELREAAAALAPFACAEHGDWFISRTGYTGEDGYEIALPQADAPTLWRALAAAGVQPCGLGARDTLRLEAGLRLYGVDMDETHTPLESGLAWTVAFEPPERDFCGRAALEAQRRAGNLPRFVGLVLEDKGVLRHGQRVRVPEVGEGVIASGIFSPTLGRSVAVARLPPGDYDQAWVDIRGVLKPVRVTGSRFLARA